MNELWKGLNHRQQSFLKVIYEADQETEAIEKSRFHYGERSRPADEWRWLIYFTYGYGDSLLKGKIRLLKMIDRGTGSTFKALEQREYILMKYEPNPPFEPIPFVRITPKGRRLVRAATKEKRPPRLPTGTLREWHWSALVLVYQNYIQGQPGVKGEGYGIGKYGGISWNTWLRLRNYKLHGYDKPLVEEHWIKDESTNYGYYSGTYYIRITQFGLEFYNNQWENYTNMYPDIIAPKPNK